MRLAQGPNYTNLFHDITTGNNFWPGSPNRFQAVPGYDLCTGLGTPNGTNLITALAGAAVHPAFPAGAALWFHPVRPQRRQSQWRLGAVRAGRHAVGQRHQLQRLDS